MTWLEQSLLGHSLDYSVIIQNGLFSVCSLFENIYIVVVVVPLLGGYLKYSTIRFY